MNKLLSDMLNFCQPISEYASDFLKQNAGGLSLHQAMNLANAIADLAKAASKLTQLVHEIAESPYPATKNTK